MTANVTVSKDPENIIKRIIMREKVAITSRTNLQDTTSKAAMPELTTHNSKDTQDLYTLDI